MRSGGHDRACDPRPSAPPYRPEPVRGLDAQDKWPLSAGVPTWSIRPRLTAVHRDDRGPPPTSGEPERALSRSWPAGRTIDPESGRPVPPPPALSPGAAVTSPSARATAAGASPGQGWSAAASGTDVQQRGAPLTGWGGCYAGERGRTRYHVARWPRHRGNIVGSIADEAHSHPLGRPPGSPQARGPCVAPQLSAVGLPGGRGLPRSCGVSGAGSATLVQSGGQAGARRRAPQPPPRWRRDLGDSKGSSPWNGTAVPRRAHHSRSLLA